MAEDYQTRKDIETLYDFIWGTDRNQLTLATKEELEDLSKRVSTCCKSSSNVVSSNSYRDLIEVIKDYNEESDDSYTLFRGDCWTINNNFECSATITSDSLSDFTVTGTFRTVKDLIGIYWNSEDLLQHPFISYNTVTDYTGVTLEFDYTMTGCRDFSATTPFPVSITINKTDGSIYYLPMYTFISNGHFDLDFDNIVLHSGYHYYDENGNYHEVTEDTPLSVTDIKSIMLVLIPVDYDDNGTDYVIMDNTDFTCEVSNITVTNGFINKEYKPLAPQQYRLCEGYDDFYNLNPYRVCKEMRKLGFVEWVDLYIGASHFYEKTGTIGDIIDVSDFDHTRTEKMKLVKSTPLNKAFKKWLEVYARELKNNDVNNLIISVSMENLQPPEDWRQRDCNNNPAITGWIPSTFFYSPCCDEANVYMQNVSRACLDIIIAQGMPPILQMGEAWWWWNVEDKPNQPPCFYDDYTKQKYRNEFGKELPDYESSWGAYDPNVTAWLNAQLVRYSDGLMRIARTYENGVYMALFFPPSVTDADEVPSMITDTNYIKDAYNPLKMDILQIEDYDWVIQESPHHEEAYTIGIDLGFTYDKLHYYGGFVQYPEDADKFWKLIEDSMDTASALGFGEVFVWAGTQVRRDNKYIGHDDYAFVYHLMQKLTS